MNLFVVPPEKGSGGANDAIDMNSDDAD